MNIIKKINSNNIVTSDILCEKYRPKDLSEFVGDGELIEKMESLITNNSMQNVILYGSSGVGKTTLAKIIVNKLNCESLFINASSDNGVDIVREKIIPFVSTISLTGMKIVVLNESDFLSISSQASLRQCTEEFSHTVKFIFTCNYIEKMINALKSRCSVIEVKPNNKVKIAQHLDNILKKENIQYELDDLKYIVNTYYPDIRQMLNNIQWNTNNNILKLKKQDYAVLDYKFKILDIIKNSKNKNIISTTNEIRQLIADNHIKSFIDLFSFLYEKINEFTTDKNIANVIIILADGQYYDAFVVDKEINIVSVILKILNEIN